MDQRGDDDQRPGPATLLARLYALISRALLPLAYRRVRRKLMAEDITPERLGERLGHASLPRPDGALLWLHAASVGESLSSLRLIDHLGRTRPRLNFLITSGTATSAKVLAKRMPPRCRHQFAPLDAPACVARFLQHWRPDAGAFIESELWPNMLRAAVAQNIPLALLNARISDRSARGWARIGVTARYLLAHFTMVHCQDERTAEHLRTLGCARARLGANLKAMAGPLPYDAAELALLSAQIGKRHVWAMASTHPGEERLALAAHRMVLSRHPDALLIMIPRHPERSEEILREIAEAGLSHTRRRAGDAIAANATLYLADTLGEMGLWYRLAPLVCLGGSFVPVGGHNPYEPAQSGAAVLHGPLYANFAAAYAEMNKAGAAQQVDEGAALGAAVLALLDAPDTLRAMQASAAGFAATQEDRLADLASELCTALNLR